MSVKGILLDLDYKTDESDGVFIRLFVKTSDGIDVFFERRFKPYFYIIVDDVEKVTKKLEQLEFEGEKGPFKISKIEHVEKANEENVLKLIFNHTREVTKVRDQIKKVDGVIQKREYDIPFVKRYLIDYRLEPMSEIEIQANDNNEIQIIQTTNNDNNIAEDLNICCFDLETYSREKRFSNAEKDPILTIAYADKKEKKVFTTKEVDNPDVIFCENEKEMIEAFVKKVKDNKNDLVLTYNGDSFDFPYLRDRAKILGAKIDLGVDGSEPYSQKKGIETATTIKGRPHLDVFIIVKFLARIGAISLPKFDLESVAKVLLKQDKFKLKAEEITQIWKTGKDMDKLIQYNMEDADSTLKILLPYLPLIIELSKLVKQTSFEITRTTAGLLVEYVLISKSFEENKLIPNKPHENEVKERSTRSLIGGYVKQPLPGLHENIAVMDFRSLHPSIIISHNISPETVNCKHPDCKKGKNVSPDGDWFCEKEEGIFPRVVKTILDTRIEIKKKMKTLDKDTPEYAMLHARQHALKIVLNSFYGTLGSPRFRWYSFTAASSVTAWSRHYIRQVNHLAEEEGYTSLYSDTDSAFLIIPKDKTEKDVLDFVKKVNDSLPGAMELEFEGMFKRGIFVTKKEGGAAKKRYALIDFKDNMKITGFEFVRRDWAVIAKRTQGKILELILKDGNPDKAIDYVRKVIDELKSGKVEKKDLIILTQIKKPLAKYEQIGPHIAAAKKAKAKGKDIGVGSVISFIITKNGKSISDKAQIEEFVKEGNYDEGYYIENQILPAVMKIIQEFGYTKEDLVQGGKQSKLFYF